MDTLPASPELLSLSVRKCGCSEFASRSRRSKGTLHFGALTAGLTVLVIKRIRNLEPWCKRLNVSCITFRGKQRLEMGERRSGGALSFFKENGSYVFFSVLVGRSSRFLRNRMLASKLGVRKLNVGPRAYLRGLTSISMGEDFSAGEGLWLEAVTHYGNERFAPKLVIGNHVHVSHWSHIACTNSVTIGDHVLIGSKVMITDHNTVSLEPMPLRP